jgi:hypothetical protein
MSVFIEYPGWRSPWNKAHLPRAVGCNPFGVCLYHSPGIVIMFIFLTRGGVRLGTRLTYPGPTPRRSQAKRRRRRAVGCNPFGVCLYHSPRIVIMFIFLTRGGVRLETRLTYPGLWDVTPSGYCLYLPPGLCFKIYIIASSHPERVESHSPG